MSNVRFERAKLNRELKRNGIDVKVYRYAQNKYGEPIGDVRFTGMWDGLSRFDWDEIATYSWNDLVCEISLIGSLRCIYHETNSYVTKQANNIATTRSLKSPMLLCRYEDVQAIGIAVGDVVRLSEGFTVSGWVNIQEWGIYAEISLERVDRGGEI